MKIRFALMAVTLAMLAGLVLGIRDSKLEQSTAFVRDAVVQHSAESIPKKATFVSCTITWAGILELTFCAYGLTKKN